MSKKVTTMIDEKNENIENVSIDWNDAVNKSNRKSFIRDVLPILIFIVIFVGTVVVLFLYYYFYTDLNVFDYIFTIIIWMCIVTPFGFFIGFIIRKLSWWKDECFENNGTYKRECYNIIEEQKKQKELKKKK